MIKVRKDNIVVLGLSDENVRRLPSRPIKFNMRELGFEDIEVYIFQGKDEQTMEQMFKDQIDPVKTVFRSHQKPQQ